MSPRLKVLLAPIIGSVLAFIVARAVGLACGFETGSTAHLAVWVGTQLLCVLGAVDAVYRTFVAGPAARVVDGIDAFAEGTNRRIDVDEGVFGDIARAVHRLADHAAVSREALEWQVEERTKDLRAVLSEVHERTRVVEEVNRRLEDIDRRRSEFLSNVSHELRTPLNSILGFLKLLIDGMYENEEERREFLDNARFSASHLLQLVTDVLTVTQIEAGRIRLDLRPLHPADVVHDVLRVMELHAREKDVALRVAIDGRAMVLADELKLRQILVNLVGNAVKFTEHGAIVVRTIALDGMTRFEVDDTGAGIPADDLERIFEKFQQVDNPVTRVHGGTGMGLSICKQLVGLMGGAIGAESGGPGKGARLWFTLPAPIIAACEPSYSE